MANITIIVPDTAVPRIRAAFPKFDATTNSVRPATVEEVRTAIKDFIMTQVFIYESELAKVEKLNDLQKESW